MKRSSMLNRAFFRRPAVRELVPDLKLVLAVLTVGCESHAGVYLPAGLGEDCGLVPAALAGALADLERRGHILVDKKTGEIFLTVFYRDNSFNSPPRQRQWHADFKQIESLMLRRAVLEAINLSPECGISVDKSLKDNKKQGLDSLGLGVAINIDIAKEVSKPAAKTTMTLNYRFDQLRAAGAMVKGCNLEKDRALLEQIRDAAAWLGENRILEAITAATYPSQAIKACRDAGLLDTAMRVAKTREADRCRDFIPDPETESKGRALYGIKAA